MATAQIVQHLRPGGIEALALTLLGQQPDNVIISLEGNKNQAISAWPRLAPYAERLFFINKPAGASFKSLYKLKALLQQENIRAVHTHHIGPFIYGGLSAYLAGIKTHIHTEHDGWHLQNTKHSAIQRALLFCLHPTLVADAKKVAYQVREATGGNSQVIYNGIDTDVFKPAETLEQKQFLRRQNGIAHSGLLIGCAGRLEAVKGQAFLINALTQLPTEYHLAIAGDGQCRSDLQELAKKLGIAERIYFLGHVNNTHRFYPMLDIFCLPSLNEGFPLAPLEAQACNIPAVVTDVGGATETLCPHTGIATTAGSAAALAAAIMESCAKKTLAQPRDFITQNFSLNRMVQAYQQLFNI